MVRIPLISAANAGALTLGEYVVQKGVLTDQGEDLHEAPKGEKECVKHLGKFVSAIKAGFDELRLRLEGRLRGGVRSTNDDTSVFIEEFSKKQHC